MNHNGMRPQDVAVLLKIIISPSNWQGKEIAEALFLSASEVSYSLQRSSLARLMDPAKRKVMKATFLEFIRYGLPYVFPAIRGAVSVGLPTAYSASVISDSFMMSDSDVKLVWPYAEGSARGESIEPLYPGVVNASLKDPLLYDLLALIDVMRIGKVREKEKALFLLKEKFDITHA